MFVYVVANRNRHLYVGVTHDLVRRVREHQEATILGFTKRYGMKRLVYYEVFQWPDDAIRREKQIKGYARVKKLALIESVNQGWKDLSESWSANAQPTRSLATLGMTSSSALRRLSPSKGA